jgi:hypothetical protein
MRVGILADHSQKRLEKILEICAICGFVVLLYKSTDCADFLLLVRTQVTECAFQEWLIIKKGRFSAALFVQLIISHEIHEKRNFVDFAYFEVKAFKTFKTLSPFVDSDCLSSPQSAGHPVVIVGCSGNDEFNAAAAHAKAAATAGFRCWTCSGLSCRIRRSNKFV